MAKRNRKKSSVESRTQQNTPNPLAVSLSRAMKREGLFFVTEDTANEFRGAVKALKQASEAFVDTASTATTKTPTQAPTMAPTESVEDKPKKTKTKRAKKVVEATEPVSATSTDPTPTPSKAPRKSKTPRKPKVEMQGVDEPIPAPTQAPTDAPTTTPKTTPTQPVEKGKTPPKEKKDSFLRRSSEFARRFAAETVSGAVSAPVGLGLDIVNAMPFVGGIAGNALGRVAEYGLGEVNRGISKVFGLGDPKKRQQAASASSGGSGFDKYAVSLLEKIEKNTRPRPLTNTLKAGARVGMGAVGFAGGLIRGLTGKRNQPILPSDVAPIQKEALLTPRTPNVFKRGLTNLTNFVGSTRASVSNTVSSIGTFFSNKKDELLTATRSSGLSNANPKEVMNRQGFFDRMNRRMFKESREIKATEVKPITPLTNEISKSGKEKDSSGILSGLFGLVKTLGTTFTGLIAGLTGVIKMLSSLPSIFGKKDSSGLDIDIGKNTKGTTAPGKGSAGGKILKAASYALPAAVAIGAANAADAGLGALGVGQNLNIDEKQDKANWERMSFLQKAESGIARGVESIGSFIGLDNLSNEAKAARVKKETEYLDKQNKFSALPDSLNASKSVLPKQIVGPQMQALKKAVSEIESGGDKKQIEEITGMKYEEMKRIVKDGAPNIAVPKTLTLPNQVTSPQIQSIKKAIAEIESGGDRKQIESITGMSLEQMKEFVSSPTNSQPDRTTFKGLEKPKLDIIGMSNPLAMEFVAEDKAQMISKVGVEKSEMSRPTSPSVISSPTVNQTSNTVNNTTAAVSTRVSPRNDDTTFRGLAVSRKLA